MAAGAAPQPGHGPAGQSPELRRALALTNEGLVEDVRFEDIARDVGLAPRSLARRFEDESGMTWRAVLRRMRVLRAIEELAAGEDSVTTIAHAVGYTSLSAFNAAFRDLTGLRRRSTARPSAPDELPFTQMRRPCGYQSHRRDSPDRGARTSC